MYQRANENEAKKRTATAIETTSLFLPLHPGLSPDLCSFIPIMRASPCSAGTAAGRGSQRAAARPASAQGKGLVCFRRRVAKSSSQSPALLRPCPLASSLAARAAPSSPPAVSSSPTSSPSTSFDWTAHWYPVGSVLSTLDPLKPNKVTLLGKQLVVWLDGSESSQSQSESGEKNPSWRAAVDECPHRLAAMSDGRLEGGTLSCRYHGASFSFFTLSLFFVFDSLSSLSLSSLSRLRLSLFSLVSLLSLSLYSRTKHKKNAKTPKQQQQQQRRRQQQQQRLGVRRREGPVLPLPAGDRRQSRSHRALLATLKAPLLPLPGCPQPAFCVASGREAGRVRERSERAAAACRRLRP